VRVPELVKGEGSTPALRARRLKARVTSSGLTGRPSAEQAPSRDRCRRTEEQSFLRLLDAVRQRFDRHRGSVTTRRPFCVFGCLNARPPAFVCSTDCRTRASRHRGQRPAIGARAAHRVGGRSSRRGGPEREPGATGRVQEPLNLAWSNASISRRCARGGSTASAGCAQELPPDGLLQRLPEHAVVWRTVCAESPPAVRRPRWRASE